MVSAWLPWRCVPSCAARPVPCVPGRLGAAAGRRYVANVMRRQRCARLPHRRVVSKREGRECASAGSTGGSREGAGSSWQARSIRRWGARRGSRVKDMSARTSRLAQRQDAFTAEVASALTRRACADAVNRRGPRQCRDSESVIGHMIFRRMTTARPLSPEVCLPLAHPPMHRAAAGGRLPVRFTTRQFERSLAVLTVERRSACPPCGAGQKRATAAMPRPVTGPGLFHVCRYCYR